MVAAYQVVKIHQTSEFSGEIAGLEAVYLNEPEAKTESERLNKTQEGPYWFPYHYETRKIELGWNPKEVDSQIEREYRALAGHHNQYCTCMEIY